jgi:hypothetical protein
MPQILQSNFQEQILQRNLNDKFPLINKIKKLKEKSTRVGYVLGIDFNFFKWKNVFRYL